MNLVRLLKTFLLSNAQNSSKILQGFKQPQINPLTPDIHIQNSPALSEGKNLHVLENVCTHTYISL